VVLAAAFVAVAVGFAQPAVHRRVPRERAVVMLALDTSMSMEAKDVKPSRFVAAKEAAHSFVDLLPTTITLGLVEFNGSARVSVAPTTDHDRLHRAIDSLQLGESTAIGEALFASLAEIQSYRAAESGEPQPARIVVLSDGKTTTGRPDSDAFPVAREAAVPVSTIAFGTAAGYIATPNEPGVQLPVPVDHQALRVIADETKGRAFTAASREELEAVYRDIGTSVSYGDETSDVSEWFIGAALVLFILGGVLAWPRGPEAAVAPAPEPASVE
jgi:Ca-activated chloride channel family protein